MKPASVLAFLLTVLVLLATVSVFVPEDGLPIGGTYRITFGKLADILPQKERRYADISTIIDTEEHDTAHNHTQVIELSFNDEMLDSALCEDSVIVAQAIDTVRQNAAQLKKKTYPIEFPNDDHTILFTFFDKLQNVKTARKPLRILHYGDSQIEGDRISAVIRQHFQEQFGGIGPGFVCPYEEAGFASQMLFDHTGQWERYARFAKKDSIVPHARFGHLASFARFSPLEYDSLDKNKSAYSASIHITGKEQWLYPLRSKFRKVSLFLGYNKTPVFIELSSKDSLLYMDVAQPNEQVKSLSFLSKDILQECSLSFTANDSPDIYGIALDDTAGVALDNISLRGSSGLEFTRISKQNLQAIYKHLDVGLVILQFGVNVVPNIRDDYTYYKKKFTKQVLRFKSIFPNIPILIVSVSDMSQKSGSYYESYPNIELIREVQREIAFENDCAFWDLYAAMGGKNSMPSWVFAKPPLAKKDFTHFNYRGAKIIGQMFYNALMNEYSEFQNMETFEGDNDGI